ncbi:MAG: Fe-S cluster assembly protein SufD [Hyphomicrobiaceae bacterium]|nr:Fe-S cluster assembly protein SufD [Hyphomicrobiaceae bacterium]
MKAITERTEAEKSLIQYFEQFSAKLPGNNTVKNIRKSAIARFSQLGLPHSQIEEWKYTDLRSIITHTFAPPEQEQATLDAFKLDLQLNHAINIDATRLTFVNGQFDSILSDKADLDNFDFKPINLALKEQNFSNAQKKVYTSLNNDPIGVLNTAFMSDGALLNLKSSPTKPIHIVHVTTGNRPAAVTTRNIVYFGKGVKVTLIESFITIGSQPTQVNSLTQLFIAPNAEVNHIKIQRESEASTHLSKWLVNLGAKSSYKGFQYSQGAELSRNEINVNFKGANAVADVSGITLLHGTQHCDTTMVIDHSEPGCESRELFKFILDDCSRGIFQGKIIVNSRAQKTDGKQTAQALLLSSSSDFNSKPELEIYADDVTCGHGSTCTQIDPELVFYCRSRGIPEAEARALLMESFAANALEKVVDESISETIIKEIRDWFVELTTCKEH